MKTLKDLTPEIKAKIPKYKDLCTKDLYSGVEYKNYDKQTTVDYIEKIYEIAKNRKPVVIVAKDPIEYKQFFLKLQEENTLELVNEMFKLKNSKSYSSSKKNKSEFQNLNLKLNEILNSEVNTNKNIEIKSHFLFLCSIYQRASLTWYKFIQDEFKIEHSNKEILDWLYERANNNILKCYFTVGFVLVLRVPERIRRNDVGFHSTKKPAIEWTRYKMYYINGRKISNDIFFKTLNSELTFNEFLKIDNEDVKAGIITMIKENQGNEGLMKFLNAEIVDEKEIKHSSGHVETLRLWKTKDKFSFLNDVNGNMNQPYTWLEETCPSTGSVFLIDSSGHFDNVIDAAKFHRPNFVPSDMDYDFKKFNN